MLLLLNQNYVIMSELANTVPPKGLYMLKLEDLWKGFIKSCGGLVVGLVIKMIQDKFRLPSYDEIEPLLEATAYFFLGYVGINFGTNNAGQLFKKDKPIVTVPIDKIKDLVEKADEGKGGDRPKDPPNVP